MNRRWYDNHPETVKAIEFLQSLSEDDAQTVSTYIIEIADQIKGMNKETDEPELSIGVERVFGLFKGSANSRRWYDQNTELGRAFKTISTLPKEDFQKIMEGLVASISG